MLSGKIEIVFDDENLQSVGEYSNVGVSLSVPAGVRTALSRTPSVC